MKIFPLKLSALLFFLFFNNSAISSSYKIATGEWAPFISETLNDNGLIASIINEALLSQNISAEYGFFPWKRAMDMAKKDSWDATAPWAMNEERKKDFYFSLPLIEESNVLVHHKDLKLSWNKLQDLSNYKIGITKGYSYGEEFSAAEKNKTLRIQRTNTDRQNLKKLIAGRIDIFIVEKNVAKNLMKSELNTEQSNNYIFNSKPLSTRSLYLLFSKTAINSKKMLATFNKGLNAIKNNGKYTEIIGNN